MFKYLTHLLVRILGGPWLGHGRMVELVLSFICLIYGLVLIFDTSASFDSQATRDLAWLGYGNLVGIPFLIKASFSGYGLIANINAWKFSRFSRIIGAFVGSYIWIWILTKFISIGVPFTFGSICAFTFFLCSGRIIGMALANLPVPGAPGILNYNVKNVGV